MEQSPQPAHILRNLSTAAMVLALYRRDREHLRRMLAERAPEEIREEIL